MARVKQKILNGQKDHETFHHILKFLHLCVCNLQTYGQNIRDIQ